MSEVTVAIELEKFIPEECRDCRPVQSRCSQMASHILKVDPDRLILEDIGIILAAEFADCDGPTYKPSGWAQTETVCLVRDQPKTVQKVT